MAGRRSRERRGRDGFAPRNALHCWGGAAWCVGAHFRGLTIPQGAVPGRAPGFGHMAPTYLCRFPGSASYGRRGSALSFWRMARVGRNDDSLGPFRPRRGAPLLFELSVAANLKYHYSGVVTPLLNYPTAPTKE